MGSSLDSCLTSGDQYYEGGAVSQYLSVTDVAKHINISKMTIYRLIESGEIPALRVGRSVRILQTDLEEYVIRNTSNMEEAK
jgi:excisionase family DNA binding protein